MSHATAKQITNTTKTVSATWYQLLYFSGENAWMAEHVYGQYIAALYFSVMTISSVLDRHLELFVCVNASFADLLIHRVTTHLDRWAMVTSTL